MNEKEARENIKFHGKCDATLYEQGYLEAINKAKGLEGFLHQIATWECCCGDGGEPSNCRCGDIISDLAWKVKAEWEKEK